MTIAALNAGVGLALSTVREHKLRSFLTVLGVIIGTGTIIGVGSIIAGLDGAITEVLRSFGPNTLIVFKFRGGPRFQNLTPEEWKRKPLTFENALAIAERCPRSTTLARTYSRNGAVPRIGPASREMRCFGFRLAGPKRDTSPTGRK